MPFTPDVSGVASSTTSASYLPNGNYDIYNLKDMYDKTLFLGYAPGNTEAGQRAVAGGYDDSKLAKVATIQSMSTEDYMREFASWSVSDPNSFAQMQFELYQAGKYGSSKPNFGVYSTDDAAAMKDAMNGYLGVVNPNSPNPLTFADYLDRASGQGKANGFGGGGGSSRAPLQLTANGTLDAELTAASDQNLGRDANDAEKASFQQTYHGQEQTQYNGGAAAGSISAEAANVTQTGAANPEYQTHMQTGYADKMLSMLGVH